MGYACKFTRGVDDHGEDGLLVRDGREFIIQVVSVPPDRGFWREAKSSRALREPKEDEAVGFLRTVIEKKAKVDERWRTLLAIDARWLPVVGDAPIREAYLTRHGCPETEFGFAEVWVVGQVMPHVVRLHRP
jgi:hypothetical protein